VAAADLVAAAMLVASVVAAAVTWVAAVVTGRLLRLPPRKKGPSASAGGLFSLH
jgi:hypothetical protein